MWLALQNDENSTIFQFHVQTSSSKSFPQNILGVEISVVSEEVL